MLSALIWIPFLGAALLGLLPANMGGSRFRSIALTIAGAAFVWNIYLFTQFNPQNSHFQFVENIPWIDWLGFNYQLGLDGLSLPLIALNTLLTTIAIFCTSKTIQRPKFYYILIFLLSGGAAGAFLATDLLLFFFFYELEIIPLYFLIAIWGGQRRGYAATKFLLYTALSGILVLASFLGVVWFTGVGTFSYEVIRQQVLPLGTQILLLSGLIVGFGIKIPFFPFHTWLPDAHVEASTPISVLLAGVLLKLGTYGLLRFCVGLFLDGWVWFAPWLATIAAISALYGACCAIAQKDMKKVVAYSSIAHMAYILLAAAATTPLSLLAAVFQMVSHGLISAFLFILVGLVYKKTGTRDVESLRGLLNPERGLPLTGSLMVLGVMASSGLPGLIGFIAEFLVFRASYPIFVWQTLLCIVGTGLTAVYFLLVINKVFFGRLTEKLTDLSRVHWYEHLPAYVLASLIFLLGIQPNWVVNLSETQTTSIIIQDSQLARETQELGIETSLITLENSTLSTVPTLEN